MRMSIRTPRFIFFGMSGTIYNGEEIDSSEETESSESLQEKLKAQMDRKEDRDKSRNKINKDLSKYNCAICFDKTTTLKNNPLCILACGHIYHTSCVIQMLLKDQHVHRCPLCRHKVDSPNEIEFIT